MTAFSADRKSITLAKRKLKDEKEGEEKLGENAGNPCEVKAGCT